MTYPRRKDRGAVIVVVFDNTTNLVAVIKEPSKPPPTYWKFPSGGIEKRDVNRNFPDDITTAVNAARREVKEETGLDAEVLYVKRIVRQSKGRVHTVHLLVGHADFSKMDERGRDGEYTRAVTAEEIESLPNMMPDHKHLWRLAVEKITSL